jgi:hypothetical protein
MKLNHTTIWSRIDRGWDPERARTTPPIRPKAGPSPKGIKKLLRQLGIPLSTYYSRRHKGLSHEQAIRTAASRKGDSINEVMKRWRTAA